MDYPGADYHSLWKLDGQPCLDPLHLREECESLDDDLPIPFWGKANSFIETSGPYPSRAYLLLTGRQITKLQSTLPMRAQPVHTLTITDGTRTYIRYKLAITAIRAIIPTAYSDIQSNQTALKPEVPYLVELADARVYADSYSATSLNPTEPDVLENQKYHYANNQWLPNNKSHPWSHTHATYGAFLNTLLNGAAYPGLNNFIIDDNALPPTAPDDYVNYGVSPWSKVHDILRTISHRLIPENSGHAFRVVGPNQLFTNTALTEFKEAAKNFLLHTENHEEPRFFPEKIWVLARTRNWQWHSVPESKGGTWDHATPIDNWKYESSRQVVLVNTKNYLPEKWWPYILPDSGKRLWLHLILTTEQVEQITDEYVADTNAIINNYLTSLTSHAGKSHVVLSGYHTKDFATCRYWDAIAYYDVGKGPMTSLYNHRRDFDPLSIKSFATSEAHPITTYYDHAVHTPAEDLTAPPDIQREHPPYYRWAIVHISSYTNANQEQVTELAPGTSTAGIALYGDLTENNQLTWHQSSITIDHIYNPFDKPLPLDRKYRIEYNYQPPVTQNHSRIPEPNGQGIWQISQSVSEGGGPDVWSECLIPTQERHESTWPDTLRRYWMTRFHFDDLQEKEYKVLNPEEIIVNRHSSLRLSSRIWDEVAEDWTPRNRSAIMDIAGGPINTVFHSQDDYNKTPRWAWEPKIWGHTMIGGYLYFNHAREDNSGISGARISHYKSAIAPPVRGYSVFHLPNEYADEDQFNYYYAHRATTGAILKVKATDGLHGVETMWSKPGITGVFRVRLYGEQLGEISRYFSFHDGLLVGITRDPPSYNAPNQWELNEPTWTESETNTLLNPYRYLGSYSQTLKPIFIQDYEFCKPKENVDFGYHDFRARDDHLASIHQTDSELEQNGDQQGSQSSDDSTTQSTNTNEGFPIT